MIDKPGEYDYESVMHVWAKGCSFLSAVPIMEIRASNVTVKNFGFKGASLGIRIVGGDRLLENVRLENIEGHSCYQSIMIPERVAGLSMDSVSFERVE